VSSVRLYARREQSLVRLLSSSLLNSTLHADSPLSVKLRGKCSALRIYQYFQSPFFSEFFFNFSSTDILQTVIKDHHKKLRVPRRFSSAVLGGNKMAAIDDFNIKLHLLWQFLCYNSVIEMNYTLTCKQLFMSFSFSLS